MFWMARFWKRLQKHETKRNPCLGPIFTWPANVTLVYFCKGVDGGVQNAHVFVRDNKVETKEGTGEEPKKRQFARGRMAYFESSRRTPLLELTDNSSPPMELHTSEDST